MNALRVGLLALIGPDVVFPDWKNLPHVHRVTEQRDGYTVTTTMVEERAIRALLNATDVPRDDSAAAQAPTADLSERAQSLVSDWEANGNSRDLGDPRAEVWHECARQLLTLLAPTDAPRARETLGDKVRALAAHYSPEAVLGAAKAVVEIERSDAPRDEPGGAS